MEKMRIAVLMGGRSAEREISLMTGEQVIKALRGRGHDVVGIDVGDDLVEKIRQASPDVCFIALHGRLGEDGTIQGLLELLEVPYTGSGILASALGIDKIATKKVFKADGIPTPEFTFTTTAAFLAAPQAEVDRIIEKIGFPAVIKPAREGSTIGMTIARDAEELFPALELAFNYDREVLVEQFVSGVEITVGILGNEPVALPTLEIVLKTAMYDYETKYTAGLSEHIIPARISEEARALSQELSVKAHQSLGCRGFSRVDIIIDEAGNPFVLEVNTIPGMTELSLYPDAARAAGIEFDVLVEKIIEFAVEAK